MIRNLLIAAASSPNQTQRNESLQILGNEFALKQGHFIDEIFNLLCSKDRTDHVLSYSYFKKTLRQINSGKLSDLNQHMEKSFIFWYQQQKNCKFFNQTYTFQKENIVELNALFLSLNTSGKHRESFIDAIPFKICQFYTKGNKNELNMYLNYYGQVLKQLVRYRIGKINSKRAAMGSVMLLKVTTKLNPENSLEASLWVSFSVNFSKFNSWIPDKGFLIKSLVQYSITRDSQMTLLEYLSTSFKIVWIIQDYCKILQGLEKIMQDCETNIKRYKCKQVETILKCLRSFLHSFFTCNTKVQNVGDAMIYQYIYSYDQFEKTSFFLMNMIDYFSNNNKEQFMGDLSHMIVEYSTQILRLYSTYLDQEVIEKYAKDFMKNFSNIQNYEKLFIFLSSLPKTMLQIFEYEKFLIDMIWGNMRLSQSYEPVYVNFLTHYISINEYIQIDMANKLAQFFFNLIQSRSFEISQVNYKDEQVPQVINKKIERVSLSVYGLSKMCKYRDFVDRNPDYFRIVTQSIFEVMLKSTNDFSIFVESINELIKAKKPQWNQVIFQKALSYMLIIQDFNTKSKKVVFYQIQIELYRIIRKTVCMEQTFGNIQTLSIKQTQILNISVNICSDLKNLVIVCVLDKKSEAVKEQIIFLLEQILVQFNRISHQGKFKPIQLLVIEFSQLIINKIVFEQLLAVLEDSAQISPQIIIQINHFEKFQIETEQYAVIEGGYSQELYLTCIKILLQLSLYEKFLEIVFLIVRKIDSKYLLCLWEAIQIMYPGKIDPSIMPLNVRQRLEKIKNGHLLDLFQKLDLNEQKFKVKQTPSWYQLYRNILRQDSIVIDIIHERFKDFVLY